MAPLVLNIDMGRMHALVVGGGRIAERKIRTLLDAGAVVHVVAPEVAAEISVLAEAGAIHLKSGCFSPGDMDGIFLVVAATNSPDVNRNVAGEALQRGILVAVTDAPESGNCSFPALLRRGDLAVAVSTQGRCPAFASEIRDLIAMQISEEYGVMLERLAAEREKLLTEGSVSTYNSTILRSRARELIDEFIDHKEQVP